MNKTLELFKRYGLVEADEMDATDMAEQPPIQDPAEMTPEGEKYLVELLVKAFLHEPDESGAATAKELQAQIEEDPKGVASAISNLVELGNGEMKETLAL